MIQTFAFGYFQRNTPQGFAHSHALINSPIVPIFALGEIVADGAGKFYHVKISMPFICPN